MRLVEEIKLFRKQYRREKAERQARKAQAEAWDRAGRPTGPEADQSWRKDIG